MAPFLFHFGAISEKILRQNKMKMARIFADFGAGFSHFLARKIRGQRCVAPNSVHLCAKIPRQIMKKVAVLVFLLLSSAMGSRAQDVATLLRLARMPLKSIGVEYPNKTGQVINDEADARLTPSELHPVFYGSFDWHSSVHSHWMLVHTLRIAPDIIIRDSIVAALDHSFTAEKLRVEAAYFDRPGGASFERTYGWAWLLKLDEELLRLATDPATAPSLAAQADRWHRDMAPLTEAIVARWKAYLPKMTYADRIGTHSNSAFGMSIALDWAVATGERDFEQQLRQKAMDIYARDKAVPADWEPNPTDFFSPSLMEADLMRRVMPAEAYAEWFGQFFTPAGLAHLCVPPIVSDLNDYHIVHLVGLSFSRAWCMAAIAKSFAADSAVARQLREAAVVHYEQGMQQIFRSNYGGDHWLGTFAAYAYEEMK